MSISDPRGGAYRNPLSARRFPLNSSIRGTAQTRFIFDSYRHYSPCTRFRALVVFVCAWCDMHELYGGPGEQQRPSCGKAANVFAFQLFNHHGAFRLRTNRCTAAVVCPAYIVGWCRARGPQNSQNPTEPFRWPLAYFCLDELNYIPVA